MQRMNILDGEVQHNVIVGCRSDPWAVRSALTRGIDHHLDGATRYVCPHQSAVVFKSVRDFKAQLVAVEAHAPRCIIDVQKRSQRFHRFSPEFVVNVLCSGHICCVICITGESENEWDCEWTEDNSHDRPKDHVPRSSGSS